MTLESQLHSQQVHMHTHTLTHTFSALSNIVSVPFSGLCITPPCTLCAGFVYASSTFRRGVDLRVFVCWCMCFFFSCIHVFFSLGLCVNIFFCDCVCSCIVSVCESRRTFIRCLCLSLFLVFACLCTVLVCHCIRFCTLNKICLSLCE